MALPVEDRLAIQDLLYRYAEALERGDEDDLLSIFTDHPIYESNVHGNKVGIEAIRELARRPKKRRYRLRRMISNFRITGSDDRARVVAYFAEFMTPLDPKPNNPYPITELLYAGEYDCDVRKIDGEWLIERRAVRVDSRENPESSSQAAVSGSAS